MSDGRLFDLDGIPEVPLFRELPPGRGALIMDERIGHDYPPEWHRCPTCKGAGGLQQNGEPPTAVSLSTMPCGDCYGMGSRKAMVRLLAGHRCERCGHPYVPKGDAKMLAVDPTPHHWSPCDPKCSHGGPIRWRSAAELDAADLDEWHYVDLEGTPAGDGIVDFGPSGERIWRYDVEAEWRILTVHHLDGDKANLSWWNLAALCQRCHLEIQARVVLERVYPHEHSDWFKPHAAGWYAKSYLGLDLDRDETLGRLDELLDLERTLTGRT